MKPEIRACGLASFLGGVLLLAGVGAAPVYALLGKNPFTEKEFPAVETLCDGDLAFRQYSGGHTDGPNWPIFLNFAARYFNPPTGP